MDKTLSVSEYFMNEVGSTLIKIRVALIYLKFGVAPDMPEITSKSGSMSITGQTSTTRV